MIKKLLLFLILINLIGCQSAKDAFTLKKKNNSDEFLVEKKSPLVLPPDYGKLPVPDELNNPTNDKAKVNTSDEIQNTLGKNNILNNEVLKNSKPSSIEESILKKIK